jgi:ankyrin repeat protein
MKIYPPISRLCKSTLLCIASSFAAALFLSALVSSCGKKEAATSVGDLNGNAEMYDGIVGGDVAKVRVLLQRNADLVFTKDSTGLTPLHWAATLGRREIAELLLADKANVDAKSDNGTTPLAYAAANNQIEVAELLLANKADVNAKDRFGQTPLGAAEVTGNVGVAELLRRHGGRK